MTVNFYFPCVNLIPGLKLFKRFKTSSSLSYVQVNFYCTDETKVSSLLSHSTSFIPLIEGINFSPVP